jgi:hypothetical protein
MHCVVSEKRIFFLSHVMDFHIHSGKMNKENKENSNMNIAF